MIVTGHPPAGAPTPADPVDQRVDALYATFAHDRDPMLVQQALDEIEAAGTDLGMGDPTARRQSLARWLRFLAQLDRFLDPAWKQEDRPVHGVAPPTPHGPVFPSGDVDPSTIPHPAVRAAYERALRQSREREREYRVQFELRRLDDRAMHLVALLLRGTYPDPMDEQELDDLLAASPAEGSRKARVRALLPARGSDRPPGGGP
jgi:hypothetical protein